MSVVQDALAWIQGGLQSIGGGIRVRFHEEPVLSTALFRAAVTAAVAFGLGWDGQQVAAAVFVFEALTAYIARSEVTPNLRVPEEVPDPYVP